jgi:hypothetical protein
MRAEALPCGLGRFRVATFGQSFHWLDRASVATTVATMLEPGGALVLVEHWSMLGDPVPGSGLPAPPYDAIARLVERHVDPSRRIGPDVTDPEPVARTHSASGSAPHRFGGGLDAFDHDLVALLRSTAVDGGFAERVRDAALESWRTRGGPSPPA